MAEKTLGEINVVELDLIQTIQTAVRAWELRNQTKVVKSLIYDYTAGGTIKYEVDIQAASTGVVTPTSPQSAA